MKRIPQQTYEKLRGHLAVMPTDHAPERREFSNGTNLMMMRWFQDVPEGARRPTFNEFGKAYYMESK